MALLVFYVLIAISVSFLCSLLEATLLTVTPSSINRAKQSGLPWGLRMEKLKEDIDRPLSAILTLNTIAHTMGAAGAGAQYAKISGNTGEAIFAAGLTLAILVFTEIIPKTIGARFANALAPASSTVLNFLITALKPLVLASKSITGLIAPNSPEADLNEHRDELLAMARIGEESGSLRERESQFVQNLIQLNAMKASDIMTPRPVIFSLPKSTPLIDFAALIENKPFTRIPVYDKNTDDFTGFIIRGDALLAHLKDHYDTGTLGDVLLPIAMTAEYTPVDALFQRFISERHHIMLVNDEFGTTVGLITFEDIIETIFGFEILDEKDTVPDLQLHARNLWHERAKKMGIELSKKSSPDENHTEKVS
ncbi:CNNM domain-containing protein [Luteolibacter algae]|uniref:CNNM domain-containing protein n=1 Tax=Luteolibacter algae TaxID=454151 RepID=A0ABW5D7D5_9BACT